MATDPQSLLAAASCYECNAANQFEATLIELGLLRQIVLASDPMADVTPQTLLSQASCYQCYGPNLYTLTLMKLALLAQISAGGGGGGGGTGSNDVIYETTDPNTEGLVPPLPTRASVAYKRDGTGAMFGWDTNTSTWF